MTDTSNSGERGSWLRTFYETAQAEIRWSKEQGWRVVNWALVLFGGLIAVARILEPVPWYYFAALALLVLLAAFFFVDDLHDSAALARDNAGRIEREIPGVAELLRHDGGGDHRLHFYVQLIILAMGFLLVLLVLAFLQ